MKFNARAHGFGSKRGEKNRSQGGLGQGRQDVEHVSLQQRGPTWLALLHTTNRKSGPIWHRSSSFFFWLLITSQTTSLQMLKKKTTSLQKLKLFFSKTSHHFFLLLSYFSRFFFFSLFFCCLTRPVSSHASRWPCLHTPVYGRARVPLSLHEPDGLAPHDLEAALGPPNTWQPSRAWGKTDLRAPWGPLLRVGARSNFILYDQRSVTCR